MSRAVDTHKEKGEYRWEVEREGTTNRVLRLDLLGVVVPRARETQDHLKTVTPRETVLDFFHRLIPVPQTRNQEEDSLEKITVCSKQVSSVEESWTERGVWVEVSPKL